MDLAMDKFIEHFHFCNLPIYTLVSKGNRCTWLLISITLDYQYPDWKKTNEKHTVNLGRRIL